MTDMENAVASALEDFKEPPREPVVLRPGKPSTLADQVQQLERVEREIISRIRREGVEAKSLVERKIAEAHADFARTLSEETARLERARDEMLRQATDEFHQKIHDLSALGRRAINARNLP